jgi:pre-rRNA-processing protein TSR2
MSLANQTGPVLFQPSFNTPTPSEISSNLELLISLSLHTWPALTLAIQNGWGGDTRLGNDKRDWLAGSISELLSTNQIMHLDDLEEVLLQVMLDEFEVVVDDDSAFDVATKIWQGRTKVLNGDFQEVQAMYENWRRNGGGKVRAVQQPDDEGQETDGSDEEEDEWNGIQDADGDEEMGEAPALVEKPRRERIEPQVDEEGFTMVQKKKR